MMFMTRSPAGADVHWLADNDGRLLSECALCLQTQKNKRRV
jgi:hypothetical protein